MHASDGFWQRRFDAWKQPDLTDNHQAIHDRVGWELESPILEIFAPDGSPIEQYDGPKSNALFKRYLWVLGFVEQIGSPYNPNPISDHTSKLYKLLYGK